MYNPLVIANYFIQKAKEDKVSLSNMKLQKLVYIAHGYYLAGYKEPLINEMVEAWAYGPVIPSLYHNFKKHKGENIEGFYTDIAVDEDLNVQEITPTVEYQQDKDFLDVIWKSYSKFSATQLSNLTHIEDSPWSQTVKASNNILMKGQDIPNDIIQSYYENRLNSLPSHNVVN